MILVRLGCTVQDSNENEIAANGSNRMAFTVVEDHHRVGPGLGFFTVPSSKEAFPVQHDNVGWRMGMELLDLFSFRQGETQRSTFMIGVYRSTLPFPTEVQMLKQIK